MKYAGVALIGLIICRHLAFGYEDRPHETNWVVVIDGQPQARLAIKLEESKVTAWRAWLNKLFSYYDRDQNGFLDADEVARLIPFPGQTLQSGRVLMAKECAERFKLLDTNGDGRVSFEELEQYYWKHGGPLSIGVVPTSPQQRLLDKIIFSTLDRNRDGRLSREEIAAAPELLNRFDFNEDGILTVDELLSDSSINREPPQKAEKSVGLIPLVKKMGSHNKGLIVELPEYQLLISNKNNGIDLPLIAPKNKETKLHWKAFVLPQPRSDFRNFASFQFASWRTSLGSKPTLSKKAIQSEPTLGWFAQQFDAIDYNGDSQLTHQEVEHWLALLNDCENCHISVSLVDHGSSLWQLLDANQDRQLDERELRSATTTLESVGRKGGAIEIYQLPRHFSLLVNKGGWAHALEISNPVFVPKRQAIISAPEWFTKMDRNGDGLLSRSEFLGSPSQFDKLDTNHDGFISVAEALQTQSK